MPVNREIERAIGSIARVAKADDNRGGEIATYATESSAPEGYAVERMVPAADAVELIVGCRRDPRFGPLVLVGLGGVYAEVLEDVAVTLAPAEPAELEALVGSLRCAPLLTGLRRPCRSRARCGGTLAPDSRHPEIEEVEINPLLAMPDGAIGLDARIVLSAPGECRRCGEIVTKLTHPGTVPGFAPTS